MTITSGFVAQAVVRAGHITGDAVMNDRDARPDPDPVSAPHGWTWDRSVGRWRPAKKRGNYDRGKPAPAVDMAGDPNGAPPDQPDSGKDPDPAWFAADKKPEARAARLSIDDIPREVVNDIAGFAGLVG